MVKDDLSFPVMENSQAEFEKNESHMTGFDNQVMSTSKELSAFCPSRCKAKKLNVSNRRNITFITFQSMKRKSDKPEFPENYV